jgi:hypothetical protein
MADRDGTVVLKTEAKQGNSSLKQQSYDPHLRDY